MKICQTLALVIVIDSSKSVRETEPTLVNRNWHEVLIWTLFQRDEF
jgi:hypothetical protein